MPAQDSPNSAQNNDEIEVDRVVSSSQSCREPHLVTSQIGENVSVDLNRTFVISSSQCTGEPHLECSQLGENACDAVSKCLSLTDHQNSSSQSPMVNVIVGKENPPAVSQSQSLTEPGAASSQSLKVVEAENTAFGGDAAFSQSQELQNDSSSQRPLGTQRNLDMDLNLVPMISKSNICYPKVPKLAESGPGGQSLMNGRLLSLESCSHIGRFVVYSWAEVSWPLMDISPQPRPDHHTRGPKLSVSNLKSKSKPLLLQGKAQTSKKKNLSVGLRKRKRTSKQSLLEVASPASDQRLRAMQRGIMDYFQRMDGPMGGKQQEDPAL